MSVGKATDKVVVLDRDGTIVVDRGYLDEPEGLAFLPGAPEGLRWFYEHGYRLIVITNQSGVGRGMLSHAQLEEIHTRFHEMLNDIGVRLEQIYYCPHIPSANCDCRKPRTGLLLQAATESNFDPATAIVIGDKSSDVEMGRRVGATTVFIGRDFDEAARALRPHFIAADLAGAALAIAGMEMGLRFPVRELS